MTKEHTDIRNDGAVFCSTGGAGGGDASIPGNPIVGSMSNDRHTHNFDLARSFEPTCNLERKSMEHLADIGFVFVLVVVFGIGFIIGAIIF